MAKSFGEKVKKSKSVKMILTVGIIIILCLMFFGWNIDSEKQVGSALLKLLKEDDSLNITFDEVAAGNYVIDVVDESGEIGVPIGISICFLEDKENQIIQESKSVRYDVGSKAEFDSVNVYLNDESETVKYVWVTIDNLEIFSDSGELLRRMEFEYELTFRINTETMEVFDVQKNGKNTIDL